MHHNHLIGTDLDTEETILGAGRAIAQSRHGRPMAGL
jgi:hypothetical protein